MLQHLHVQSPLHSVIKHCFYVTWWSHQILIICDGMLIWYFLFLKIIVFRLFLKFLKTNSVKKNILAIFSLTLFVSHHRLLKSLNVFLFYLLFSKLLSPCSFLNGSAPDTKIILIFGFHPCVKNLKLICKWLYSRYLSLIHLISCFEYKWVSSP